VKSRIQERLKRNLARVRHLVDTYGRLAGAGQGRRRVNTSDLLRAATVFLHATLEDFLRSIELWKLPAAGEDRLNQIALAGTIGRAEKFALGKLASHRGKTVDALIAESVTQHLERSNYNTTEDVVAVLKLAGVIPEDVNKHFGKLAELMRRRHHIVHQADKNERPGHGQFQARSIGTTTVNRWVEAVEAFGSDVLDRL
jgi:hypothetical protein